MNGRKHMLFWLSVLLLTSQGCTSLPKEKAPKVVTTPCPSPLILEKELVQRKKQDFPKMLNEAFEPLPMKLKASSSISTPLQTDAKKVQ